MSLASVDLVKNTNAVVALYRNIIIKAKDNINNDEAIKKLFLCF